MFWHSNEILLGLSVVVVVVDGEALDMTTAQWTTVRRSLELYFTMVNIASERFQSCIENKQVNMA